MATQYTSILKLALPVQGELSGTWGDVVNNNITSMVEEAVAGRSVINSWSGNSHTLTTADGTTAEARAAILEFTDTSTDLSGAATVICPAASTHRLLLRQLVAPVLPYPTENLLLFSVMVLT